jgi:hypothetical protein
MATKTKKPSNLAPPMATKAQRAKNVRSGRQRMYGGVGAGLTGAAAGYSLGVVRVINGMKMKQVEPRLLPPRLLPPRLLPPRLLPQRVPPRPPLLPPR